jgi:phospholipid/cholesterol/gamma-HCH transport system substrate-binding protein
MSSGARPDWSDLRLGLFVLAAVVPVAAGVFWLDEIQRLFAEGPELVVTADEIHGLEPGDGVWVAGHTAGRVTEISFVGTEGPEAGRVAVRLVLLRDAAPALRSDATARIGSGALLEPPVVKLSPGSPDAPPYDFADTLEVSALPGLEEFRALADSGRTALEQLREDADALARELEAGSGTLPRLRRDPELVARLARQRTRLARLEQAWNGNGMGALWRDTALHARAGVVAKRLRETSAATGADSTGGPAARIPPALGVLRARVDRLSRRLDAAEGTLGRLGADDELRRQEERTRALLDSLLAESMRHPLRFLHFRLF